MEDAGATVNVGSYNVVGNVCDNGGSYTPSPTTGAASVADPIAAETAAGTLTAPTTSGMTTQLSWNSPLSPGYYPYGITFNGGTSYTLNPGVYYFGTSVTVNSGARITGTGVTIYMAGSGQLNMNQASTMSLSAPTTGPTAGIVLWAASGNASGVNLDTASNSSFGGGNLHSQRESYAEWRQLRHHLRFNCFSIGYGELGHIP
jgi:hypothetical protein